MNPSRWSTGIAAVGLLFGVATVNAVPAPGVVEVTLDDGSSADISLLGIAPSACAADAALAREQQLVDGQSVTLDLNNNATDTLRGQVWLADGRSLAEVLVLEGLVPVDDTDAPPILQASLDAAQASAISQSLGIWAPAACTAVADDASRAQLDVFVTGRRQALADTRLATGVLLEQSRSAPLLASTPAWQATANRAVGWARQASQVLQAPAPALQLAQPLPAELSRLGSDLQAQADALAVATASGDASAFQAAAAQLQQTQQAADSAAQQLDGLAAAYAVGD